MISIHGLDIIAPRKELRVPKSSVAAKAVALIEDFNNAFYIASVHSETLHGNCNDNILPKKLLHWQQKLDRCYLISKICK